MGGCLVLVERRRFGLCVGEESELIVGIVRGVGLFRLIVGVIIVSRISVLLEKRVGEIRVCVLLESWCSCNNGK